MTSKYLAFMAIATLLAACGKSTTSTDESPNLAAEAQRIADSYIIVDTHIDVPMQILEKGGDISTAVEGLFEK